jgi:hypothetical protein
MAEVTGLNSDGEVGLGAGGSNHTLHEGSVGFHGAFLKDCGV